jgi:hypothetical protein
MATLIPACLSAALDYLRRGWPALAVCPVDHHGVSGQHERECRRPGREPLYDWTAYQQRLPREAELRLFWSRYPRAGVGIALGALSGLVGLDVSGTAAEEQLAERSGGDLPDTLEFLTRTGGRCLLYALPSGLSLPQGASGNSAESGELRLLAGGDLMVMPPTPGYAWVAGHGPGEMMPAPSPSWLAAWLAQGGESPTSAPDSPDMVPDDDAGVPRRGRRAPRPAVCTAAELMTRDFAEMRWAVPDILPEGGTILAGRPKTGKSWLTLGLAVAVAAGVPALGGIEVAQGEVLYLALEDGPRRLRRRLEKVLGARGLAAPQGLHLATGWPRSGEGGLQRIDEWLHAHPAARLVIVDTLARIRDRRSEAGNLYEEDYLALARLKDLGDRYACAVVVVHHTRKGAAEDPLESIHGTLGLTGAADCVLVLKRARQCDEARLFVTGRDVDEHEVLLVWERTRCVWSRNDSSDGLTREQRAVITAMQQAGRPMTCLDLVPLVHKSKDALKQLLRRMADEYGLIRRGPGKGTYVLPAPEE